MRRLLLPIVIFLSLFSSGVAQEKSDHPVPLREAYDSWKLAKDGRQTPAATISVPEGFAVDLIKVAEESQGSWIGMTFDTRGRLYIAIEKKGILRLTIGDDRVAKTELVDSELLECRGLLWAYDSLYANANNSRGLYRLQDTDGDDQFDQKTLLLKTEGGVGHGRNHLRLGPDGLIYIVHGNDVVLSEKVEDNSSLRNFEEDQLIPNPWDDKWFNKRAFVPAGHILRMDEKATRFELFAGGLRNPLDIDFNADGEAFIYEADMEWESALAWYKPTRVLHIVSGGDYGWRRATGKWPAYYEDSLPAAHDVGLGSPTGVEFGSRSNFPDPWKHALFIADWSYGRILAIHLKPDGSSYQGSEQTFVLGRPLNVTDFTFGYDGSMYFITGGRGTQSALYRVRWTGRPNERLILPTVNPLRGLRRKIEYWHTHKGAEGVAMVKQNLGHSDRWIRYAARVALENQDPKLWQDWAKQSDSPHAVMALARLRLASTDELIHQLSAIAFDRDPLNLLRAYHLVFARCGQPGEAGRISAVKQLSPRFPSTSTTPVNHELCELLTYLRAPDTLGRTLDLLDKARTTEDLSQYLTFCRYLLPTVQCTVADRTLYSRRFLQGLRRMEDFSGGRWYDRTVTNLQKEAEAWLTDEQKIELADVLKPKLKKLLQIDKELGEVNHWKMVDFDKVLESPLDSRNFNNGNASFIAAQCANCHRAGGIDAAPPVNLGPDLTGIGSRFGIGDMLESMIHPSRVIGDKYRNPAGPNVSLMPAGLINRLDKDSVLDLLAFLQSGGNKSDAVFSQ